MKTLVTFFLLIFALPALAASPMQQCYTKYMKAKKGVTDSKRLEKIDADYEKCAEKNKDKADLSAPKEGVRIGMTEDQALASSWGSPQRRNNTTSRHGTRSQWVYGSGNYLYFENGILTSISN